MFSVLLSRCGASERRRKSGAQKHIPLLVNLSSANSPTPKQVFTGSNRSSSSEGSSR
jgi:hypothetical protein